MSELVLARRDGPVLVLTLNDPERANPLSAPLAVTTVTCSWPASRT